MKLFKKSTIKKTLLTFLAVFASTICAVLGVNMLKPNTAKADSISKTVFQTDGASVRVLKWNGEAYEETDRKGIRFHVEMGAGYEIATGTPLLDTTQTNANGSFKMAEGYKSYTLVIPTRLMNGSTDLTMDLEKVVKIDTTDYWFVDGDDNWESVAYIYNVPEKWYTDEFTYRGIVVSVDENGNETPVKWTPTATRSLAWVAKQAYKDTMSGDIDWGSEENNDYAATEIKKFFPVYNVVYSNGAKEEVLWGDKLTQADVNKTYYDETNHTPVEVNKPLDMPTSGTINLKETTESTFVFTGVEYSATGFNVFATLPTSGFANGTELEPSAVDMVTNAGKTVVAKSVKVSVMGVGADAITKLQIGFDYTDISNGTELTILKTSHFYNDGVLYELEQDYEFVYNNNVWELPLGYITLGDLASIVNFTEQGASGKEENIRITFRKDILINGGATFKDGGVTVTRKTGGAVESITDAYYYWNQGEFMILEIPGEAGGNLWGKENGDVLKIAAGTKLVQNNGFFVFQDDIVATFNGGTEWVFSSTVHEIDASAFTNVYTRSDANGYYIDAFTTTLWADKYVKVVCNDGTLTYHHTDNVSTVDPTQIEYRGDNAYQALRIRLDANSQLGDWVTIPKNTEFWVGNQIYKLTEDITSYFVGTTSNVWATNPTITNVSLSNIVSMGWYQGNVRYTTDTVWSNKANNLVIVDDTFIEGDGIEVVGSNYTGLYYYGGANKILELQGTNFSSDGGSATIKKGVILWLFAYENGVPVFTGAYKLEADLAVAISGAAGSIMYKDVEVASVSKSEIAAVYNDGSHAGEVRFEFNGTKLTGMYGAATVEGSATLNGEATSSAYVYGGDGTSGYTGNTIIAFTGEAFGRPFQATAFRDRVHVAAGTKVWLSNGSGYVTITDDLSYVWNGSAYLDANVQRTVTFNSGAATVKVDGVETASCSVSQGEKVTFTVEVPAGYQISSITNATLVDATINQYETGYLFGNVAVTIACVEPIKISQADVLGFHKEGASEIRIALNKERADISAITGGNYNVTFDGTTELFIGGRAVQPTQYNYFGVIGEANHQLIGIACDVASMVSGDSITIKAGSVFKWGSTVLLVEGDIVGRMLGITANFDDSVATLSLDGAPLVNGATVPMFVGTGTSTLVFGWKDESYSSTYDLSVKINGVEQGNSGTYTIELTGEAVIDVTTPIRTYTATVNASNASVSGIANNATITHGQTYNFTVSANSGCQLTSVTINGAEQGTGGSYSFTASGPVSIVVTAKKFYTVTATTSGGVTVDAASKTVAEGESATFTLTVPSNATIKANGTQISGTSYTVSNVTSNTTVAFTTWYTVSVTSLSNASVTVDGTSRSQGWSELRESGTSITVQASYSQNNSRSLKVGSNSWSDTSSHTVTISGKTDISASSSGGGCLVEGTLVTLADGTKKAVEDLKAGDLLVVFNHETGKYDVAPLLVNTHATAEADYYTVISLYFSNGEVLKIADEHAVFSKTANKYVYINADNAYEFIGHEFVSSVYENGEVVSKIVTLNNVTLAKEYTRIFTPVSAWHMNLVGNDMLTLSGRTTNFFEYDETMKYDEEKMQADIEKYGLYTYEDFADYVPEEVFNAFPFKYFKVAIEKGEYTWEELMFLISEYNESDSEK